MSSTGQLKFEENVFFFSRVFPQWYKKPWLWTIIYHWGNTLIKKKQFFLNFSFPIEDAEKWIKHHFFVYKKSISDQNFKDMSQKIGLPRPWEVQNWNGCGADSIFESHPPNFGKSDIFWKSTNDIIIIFRNFHYYKSLKKCTSAICPEPGKSQL